MKFDQFQYIYSTKWSHYVRLFFWWGR